MIFKNVQDGSVDLCSDGGGGVSKKSAGGGSGTQTVSIFHFFMSRHFLMSWCRS